ncbi:MAG: 1-acyl-sn-glycerol-3-phosphate acyltransferase [Christensenellaceae bacterium]|jgi:1-acyl-sn-glycerol-3-phosphate acyltransferase|nr:1-acyl-sn-glycerol-3-phosphate acyltransferase [Christensenellaceae bacterium]
MAKYHPTQGWQRSKKFKCLKMLIRPFKRRPKIIELYKEPMIHPYIMVSNHSGAAGPFTFEMFLDRFFCFWGTHEMCEGIRNRWNYLYHKFYRKSLHYSKFRSWLIATVFSPISKMLYRATEVIPTYSDIRLKRTMEISINKLNEGKSILIFPEDSSTGYHTPLIKYNAGFASLSKLYFSKTQKDLPVYPICYSKKVNTMIIGEPIFVNQLLEQGFDDKQVAEFVKRITNEIYYKYLQPKEQEKDQKKQKGKKQIGTVAGEQTVEQIPEQIASEPITKPTLTAQTDISNDETIPYTINDGAIVVNETIGSTITAEKPSSDKASINNIQSNPTNNDTTFDAIDDYDI